MTSSLQVLSLEITTPSIQHDFMLLCEKTDSFIQTNVVGKAIFAAFTVAYVQLKGKIDCILKLHRSLTINWDRAIDKKDSRKLERK